MSSRGAAGTVTLLLDGKASTRLIGAGKRERLSREVDNEGPRCTGQV
ncbi:hypothetical protein E2C01_077800 [Portunus trituberculatus]|uniref:Uncharacterized protein n=1 Tax=Portunus trituberculatus TaxID=210409 RepID=A0A5B7IMA5_PORTR|nr:hypothetical protein [Portunus trituberculatus]